MPEEAPPTEHMSPITYDLRGGDSSSQPSDEESPWQVLPVTTDDEDNDMIMPVGDWQDVDINIALDSGACNHVLDAEDVPGYRVVESPGSRRGQNFIVGNGAGLPNEGQVHLNLEVPVGDEGRGPLQSTFQVADGMCKPLMSVAKVCDAGYACLFTKTGASVLDQSKREVCTFEETDFTWRT